MSLAQRACPRTDKGKQDALEEGGWLVQALLEGIVEMDVPAVSGVSDCRVG